MKLSSRRYLAILLILILTSCSSIKNSLALKQSIDIEVSNFIVNYVSEVPVVINKESLAINLANAASAEKIILHFKTEQKRQIKELVITCQSQCGIEFSGDLEYLEVENLKLIHAHLLNNPEITVESITILSSEAIRTGLPNNVKNAEIKITSSPNMLEVQKLLKSVNIIPGSGEFVYDTKIIYNANSNPINYNNNQNVSDALYNLRDLTRILPNLEWTSPVVTWLGVVDGPDKSNMDVSQIRILPGIESKEEASEVWNVANYNRDKAYLISKDKNGSPNWGGTINDASLLRYVEALRNSRLKIMFYPMIGMDTPGKSWRGFIKADNPEDIHHFFTKSEGYNEFILHYAKLLKGKVNAFVIGSEMQDLTQSSDNRYSYPDARQYPAVQELIELAKQVKEILGPNVIVTYAANWTEYHHDKNFLHHLDSLWASKYIDVVGIDAYLPITNKSMGDITIQEIKNGWNSGELWNYYYDRNKKESITPEWGLKQIEYWWRNEHWAHGIKSLWNPKMKPIWFTEFGFPSMHLATNTPNAYWNPQHINGGVPKKSSGRPDFAIQMRAIRATLEYWRKKSDVVQNMFLWAWDARPFPYSSSEINIWSDSEFWSRGHWINGKIEPLSQVRLLPNVSADNLTVNAKELVIDGKFKINKIKANNIQYIPTKL